MKDVSDPRKLLAAQNSDHFALKSDSTVVCAWTLFAAIDKRDGLLDSLQRRLSSELELGIQHLNCIRGVEDMKA